MDQAKHNCSAAGQMGTLPPKREARVSGRLATHSQSEHAFRPGAVQ
jgi:hypothetical protein